MTVRLKYIVALILFSLIVACGEGLQQKADMYEASELSKMMRDMVTWSKQAKHKLQNGGTIQHVPLYSQKQWSLSSFQLNPWGTSRGIPKLLSPNSYIQPHLHNCI